MTPSWHHPILITKQKHNKDWKKKKRKKLQTFRDIKLSNTKYEKKFPLLF